MRREIKLHAYQLEVGDLVESWEGWYLVHNLKGSYMRGRGLLVDILLDDGWHRVECLSILKVSRNV